LNAASVAISFVSASVAAIVVQLKKVSLNFSFWVALNTIVEVSFPTQKRTQQLHYRA
jgi:hypothetical protein